MTKWWNGEFVDGGGKSGGGDVFFVLIGRVFNLGING